MFSTTELMPNILYTMDSAKISDYMYIYVTHMQLLNTRSTDRKTSLMQYIVNLMKERFPEYADFTDEIMYLKKAGLSENVHMYCHTSTTLPFSYYVCMCICVYVKLCTCVLYA